MNQPQQIKSQLLTFLQFNLKIKNGKDRQLLIEAYRRYNQFEKKDNRTLANAWVGLGYPNQYKSTYFRSIETETARVLNWYSLNLKGIEVMEKLLKQFPWDSTYYDHLF
jgi:hypothetical protein